MRELGVTKVTKDELVSSADVLGVFLVFSERSRNTLRADDLAKMKRDAILVNISRGPIVEEAALIEALRSGRLAVPVSTSSTVSHFPPTTPFGRSTTSSSPRTWATSPSALSRRVAADGGGRRGIPRRIADPGGDATLRTVHQWRRSDPRKACHRGREDLVATHTHLILEPGQPDGALADFGLENGKCRGALPSGHGCRIKATTRSGHQHTATDGPAAEQSHACPTRSLRASKRMTPTKPSRIMSSVHRSPMTTSALATEQFMSSRLVRLILQALS